jgi:hypothetical protein
MPDSNTLNHIDATPHIEKARELSKVLVTWSLRNDNMTSYNPNSFTNAPIPPLITKKRRPMEKTIARPMAA